MVIRANPDGPSGREWAPRRGRGFRAPGDGRTRGSISAELLVAVGILVVALMPLSVSLYREAAVARGLYSRALALEIVDGEMEALVAGEWRAFRPGPQLYTVRAESVTNLPPGRFQLTLLTNRIRLEWRPAAVGQGGAVVREVNLPLNLVGPTCPSAWTRGSASLPDGSAPIAAFRGPWNSSPTIPDPGNQTPP